MTHEQSLILDHLRAAAVRLADCIAQAYPTHWLDGVIHGLRLAASSCGISGEEIAAALDPPEEGAPQETEPEPVWWNGEEARAKLRLGQRVHIEWPHDNIQGTIAALDEQAASIIAAQNRHLLGPDMATHGASLLWLRWDTPALRVAVIEEARP